MRKSLQTSECGLGGRLQNRCPRRRPLTRWRGPVWSLGCLLSTALLDADRADSPLSLRLQSCSAELLPLALNLHGSASHVTTQRRSTALRGS